MDDTDIAFDMASRLFTALEESGTAAAQGAAWAQVEELGFPLALVPEELGGIGLDPVQALALLRLAGHHALPLPLADTMLANALLASCGVAPVAGPASVAIAPADHLPILRHEKDAWHLGGQVEQVPWGRDAHRVAVLARSTDGLRVVALDGRTHVTQRAANLADEPRDTLMFDTIVAEPLSGAFDHAHACGAIIRTVLMAGAMERVLTMCTQYALDRVQFGRPIGRFQAIQQNMAVMAGHVVAARAAADMAAEAWSDPDLLVVGAAKIRAGEAAGTVAALAHQVHGAIGFAREHALHRFTRRLWSWRDEFGNESFWAKRVGAMAQDAGAEGYWPMVAAT
jgi:alkylation response protein AidB-like acyl-CoA dehydrogenase